MNRNFNASGPNQPWITDISEYKAREGTVHASVVLAVFFRKAVDWVVDRRLVCSLVSSSLFIAYPSRKPAARGIIHPAHGTQFTSRAPTSNVEK